jgi:hypothetical protein
VARLIGGGDFDYTSAGDVKASIAKPASGHAGRRATPGAQPLTDSLRAEYLALPANVLDILTPPPPATAAPRILCHPHGLGVRCFRLPKRAPRKPPASCWTPAASTAWHGSMRATATAGRAGAGQLLQKTWKRDACRPPSSAAKRCNWRQLGGRQSAQSAGRRQTASAGDSRSAAVDASWRNGCKKSGQRRDCGQPQAGSRQDSAYLADERSIKLRALPVVPPGAPI